MAISSLLVLGADEFPNSTVSLLGSASTALGSVAMMMREASRMISEGKMEFLVGVMEGLMPGYPEDTAGAAGLGRISGLALGNLVEAMGGAIGEIVEDWSSKVWEKAERACGI